MPATKMPQTAPPMPPTIDIVEPLCAVFRRTLKKVGQKYTPERAQILDAVIRTEGIFEAERLLADLRAARFRVSKATVYRTLKLLLDAGILRRVLVSEEQAHYQLVYGKRPTDLIIVVDTGKVIEIDLPELSALRDRLCREHGLIPQGHSFQVFATAISPARPPA
jgi:Fur family transcriptional regulator, ferric uptake regulator